MKTQPIRLDLRKLPERVRNDCLDDAVAEHVAGFRWAEDVADYRSGAGFRKGTICLVPPDYQDAGALEHLKWKCPTKKRVRSEQWRYFIPRYSTRIECAMSLLPELDDELKWSAHSYPSCYLVTIWSLRLEANEVRGSATAKTLPLAICIALLRSRGVEVLL